MRDTKSRFLTQLLLVFTSTALLASISYFFCDKAVACWMVEHHPLPHSWLKTISHIPKLFEILALLVFFVYVINWIVGPISNLLCNLGYASISLVVTDFWIEWSKYSFGRYWPRTWANNNPSFIDTNEYGFHFFHSKAEAFQSFPSGHTALTIAVVTYLALAYPRLRAAAVLIGLLVPLSLISLDYHFLADTIAGAGLGWMVAYSIYYLKSNLTSH